MNKNLSLTKKECYVLISSASMSSISMDKKESTQHGKGMKDCLSTRNLNVFDKPRIIGGICLNVGNKFVLTQLLSSVISLRTRK